MGTILFLLLLCLTTVTSDITQSFILNYQNYTIPDTRFVCLNFEITANISAKCEEQLEVVCGNMALFATLFDASSKFPYTGLGYASKLDYGNFDQCLTIDHEYEGGRILGKHCNVGLLIPDVLGNISDIDSYYKLATCMPDGCSASDYNEIAKNIIADFPPLFLDERCQTIESFTEITTADVVTITIFTVCSLLMIFCTIYDIYLLKTESKSLHPLCLSFSVLSNGRKLLQISKNSKEQIQTFHGIKVISMMWIVAGHGFVGWQNISVSNRRDADTWLGQRYAGYIATAPLAVDTFFFISGFLLAFQYFKGKTKPLMVQVSSVPSMYIHRYLRLTPAMLMVYLVSISVFKHLGSGPLWTTTENLAKPCRDHWWSFFLYIQNYYNWDNICLTHTWYLSADMQMFLLAPLVIIPISLILRKSSGFKLSMVGLFILNLFCIAIPMALKLVFRDYGNTYDTHSRLINYFIGMMLALFIRMKQDKPFLYGITRRRVSVTNFLTWVVILLGMLTTIICYQEVEMNHGYESKSVFYSLMRPAWCIGLSWIVYSCYHGYGGIVNSILSSPTMQVMGRLTYCMYLTHGSVIIYYIVTIRETHYFSDYNVFYAWCGHFIVSTIVSIFWTLAFESPLIIIEKHLLGKQTEGGKQPQLQNGNSDIEAREKNIS